MQSLRRCKGALDALYLLASDLKKTSEVSGYEYSRPGSFSSIETRASHKIRHGISIFSQAFKSRSRDFRIAVN